MSQNLINKIIMYGDARMYIENNSRSSDDMKDWEIEAETLLGEIEDEINELLICKFLYEDLTK